MSDGDNAQTGGQSKDARPAAPPGPLSEPVAGLFIGHEPDERMKIQVQCRRGGEPRMFLVGEHWLYVNRVLEHALENSLERFRVRVPDGREFVLRRDRHSGDWQLARVAARPA
jgi:hypothetical protein